MWFGLVSLSLGVCTCMWFGLVSLSLWECAHACGHALSRWQRKRSPERFAAGRSIFSRLKMDMPFVHNVLRAHSEMPFRVLSCSPRGRPVVAPVIRACTRLLGHRNLRVGGGRELPTRLPCAPPGTPNQRQATCFVRAGACTRKR